MIKTIEDSCPGASPARAGYLETRIDRVFGDEVSRIVEVALSLRVVQVEGDDRFEAAIRCELVDGSDFSTSFVRPTLPVALACAFEGAAYRLTAGRNRPPRGAGARMRRPS